MTAFYLNKEDPISNLPGRSSINHHQTNPIATTQPHPESAEHPKSPEIGHFSPTITLSSQSLQSNPSK